MQAPASIVHRHPDPYRQVRSPADDDPGVCAGQLRIAGQPAAVAAAIRSADPATQDRLIGQLQRHVGNETVGRLLAAATGPAGLPVQRYPVSVPAGSSDCAVVVNWLDRNSPYRQSSGWARTNAVFGWGGDFAYSGSDDSLTVGLANPSVTLRKNVDMPTWAPTSPAMSSAWSQMTAGLRQHEARHEGIADTWKDTLLGRLTSLSLPIASRAEGPAAVRSAWQGWIAEHQAEQTSIDPFTATLDCSAASPEAAAVEPGASADPVLAAGDPNDNGTGAA